MEFQPTIIRCTHCGRLLAKGEAVYMELKCDRCGAYTILRATRPNTAPLEGLQEVATSANRTV